MTIHEVLELQFTPIAPEHIQTLEPIEAESYPDPWSAGMFQQETENAMSRFYIAISDQHVVGYGGFWLLMDEAHITKITVAQSYRKQGLGTRIMDYLIEQAEQAGAKTMRLEVRQSNTIAQAIYARLDFKVVGIRKGYYARSREDAVVMVKYITD